VDLLVAQLTVAKTTDRIVFIKALLRLGCGFDVPFDHRQTKCCADLAGKLGFAGAGFAFHQQGAFQCDGCVDSHLKVIGGNIGVGAFELHNLFFR
jgi:hypothetical protein